MRDRFGRHCHTEALLDDGRARVRVGAPIPLDLARNLAGWGGLVDVEGPPEVRALLARIGAELTERYAADPRFESRRENGRMARSRFVGDAGLTARMTLVMFLLGAVFVGLIVGLMYAFRGSGIAILIGVGGIGFAIYQWYNSDKVAMKAMRAREVTPEQAPELHGMIDRLCALADMPKPRVGIADTSVPNAFATGRSPERSVVCVTTGILQTLTAEELEGVLAHELSHVAHRDVLVMTVAASAGITAGMLAQGAQYGAFFGGGRRDNNSGGLPDLAGRAHRQRRSPTPSASCCCGSCRATASSPPTVPVRT